MRSIDPLGKVLLLNGPNLNRLGLREPHIYGMATLKEIESNALAVGNNLGFEVYCHQSNSESVLIDLIHNAQSDSGIVINPGALAHYSYALRDAITSIPTLVIEVHISNIHAREEFRHKSVISPVVDGFICGCGAYGYELALRSLAQKLRGRIQD